LLAFIRKYFEESHLFIQLFYGPRLKRKELSELFFKWRKSKNRSLEEKNKIIISGVRSQYSDLFKNWKWIIIQTILWLAISIKFDFNPIINIMAFFTILNQFIQNITSLAKDKRQTFNIFIAQEILSTLSFSSLLLEKVSDLKKGEKVMKAKNINYASDCEWTDINIQLLPNEYNDELPYLRINIGHEKSEVLHASKLGLVQSSDYKTQNELFIILKAFGKYSSFKVEGHGSQKKAIEKSLHDLIENLNLYFGERDIMPIIKNDKTGNWECFVNIEDRTNSWHQLELERYEDIKTMLQEWVPLIEELEKVDLAEQSYRMKGYEW